jgi:hypothetical protein
MKEVDLNKAISVIVTEGFRPAVEKIKEAMAETTEGLRSANARISLLESRLTKLTRHLSGALEGVQASSPTEPKKRKRKVKPVVDLAAVPKGLVTMLDAGPSDTTQTKAFFEHPKKTKATKVVAKPRRGIKVVDEVDPVEEDNIADRLGITAMPAAQKH